MSEGSTPTPHELQRDLEQLERSLGGRLQRIEDSLERIRRDMVVPSTFVADQSRQDQRIDTMLSEVQTIRDDARAMRRLVVGSLLFPIIVIVVAGILLAGMPGP